MSATLDIAPEIVNLLGSEAAMTKLFDTAEAGYRCTVCGEPGRLAETEPAAVLLLAYTDGPNLIRYAHAGCSRSGVVPMHGEPTVDTAIVWPAVGWLHSADTDPAPVLVIAPRAYRLHVTPGGDTADGLTSALLAYGFDLFTHPDATMTPLDAVAATLAADGTLTLSDEVDEALWSGLPDWPDGWADTARSTGRIGVVFIAGAVLDDPGTEQLAAVFTAIGDGRAVAASVELD